MLRPDIQLFKSRFIWIPGLKQAWNWGAEFQVYFKKSNLTRFFLKKLWFFFNLSIALNKLLWFQRLNSLGLPQHEVWPLTHPFLRSFWKSKKQEIYSTTIEIEFTIQGRRNKGADHTHHITIRPSDYHTFLRPCRRGEILYAIRSM